MFEVSADGVVRAVSSSGCGCHNGDISKGTTQRQRRQLPRAVMLVGRSTAEVLNHLLPPRITRCTADQHTLLLYYMYIRLASSVIGRLDALSVSRVHRSVPRSTLCDAVLQIYRAMNVLLAICCQLTQNY